MWFYRIIVRDKAKVSRALRMRVVAFLLRRQGGQWRFRFPVLGRHSPMGGIGSMDVKMSPSAEPQTAEPAQSAAARAGVVAQLFRHHNRNLVHFIQARLGGPVTDANEVAQEAYVRLLQLENTGAVSFLRAYLYRIAANLVMDRLSAQRRHPEESVEATGQLEQIADPFEVERTVLAADQYQQLLACLRELPPKCREAFVLHRMRQQSTEEVARRMGISERMVRKHVARALIYCRYRLDGESPQRALEKLGHD
jgi:RNA polymerase sigma factor (sigma-70 family)